MSNESKQGDFEFSLEWQSKSARHVDRVYFSKANLWRDFFPGRIGEKLEGLTPGESVGEDFEAGVLVENHDRNKVYKIIKRTLNLDKMAEKGIYLRMGRFHPRGAISGFGFFSGDVRPLRVIHQDETHIWVDSNHPLCNIPLTVKGSLLKSHPERSKRGGSSNDIGYTLVEGGPGLQGGLTDVETDFYSDDPFLREDQSDDHFFYTSPRMVNHVDETAASHFTDLYGRFIKPGMKVLDLMASWNSHLKTLKGEVTLTGVGLNQQELDQNPLMQERVCHDLNQNTQLPFKTDSFDAVICTVSIEYLIHPFAVLGEVGRVLKKGAPFIITFSDRWFPPKVIKLWKELHPFERVALVVNYFEQSGRFTDIHTETIRGYPRPSGDRQGVKRMESDPVFAVWAVVK